MRKMLVILSLLLLLAACTSFQSTVDADARVASFRSIFPEATYVQQSYTGAEAASLHDIVVQECGSAPSEFTRATYLAKAATLSAYVDANGTLFCVASKLNQDAFSIEKGDSSTVANGTLMTVNGDPIMLSDLQRVAASLPAETRNQTNVSVLLNQLVNRKLLEQAAVDVVVNESDVDALVASQWRAAGLGSEEEFRSSLAQQGVNYDTYRSSVKMDVKIQRLLDEVGVTDVNVSESDAQAFYLNNPNSFLVGEQVRFRQLFVSNDRGEEIALNRLQNALKEINASKDFCEVVRTYSDDTESKDRCGEYVAPRGVLLPELESAIFSLGVNQSTVVKSSSGYHIIVVLEKQPTTVVSYAQARQQVMGALRNSLVGSRLNVYLLKLRADATIVDYTQ